MLIFKRGYRAARTAYRTRGEIEDSKRVVQEETDTTSNEVLGAVAVEFVGRFARRSREVEVVFGTELFRFSTERLCRVVLRQGWHPIEVPQAKTGTNMGAVRVIGGFTTVLSYRPDVMGPPDGKFLKDSARLMRDSDNSLEVFTNIGHQTGTETWAKVPHANPEREAKSAKSSCRIERPVPRATRSVCRQLAIYLILHPILFLFLNCLTLFVVLGVAGVPLPWVVSVWLAWTVFVFLPYRLIIVPQLRQNENSENKC